MRNGIILNNIFSILYIGKWSSHPMFGFLTSYNSYLYIGKWSSHPMFGFLRIDLINTLLST